MGKSEIGQKPISNPKSQISNWTLKTREAISSHGAPDPAVQFEISGFRICNRFLSNFPILPSATVFPHAVLLLLLLCLTSCRQYMADQPSYKPYRESGFFTDGTSARPLPEGVIPQGFERSKPSVAFPFPVTMDVLKRGEERYNIFCTPCHDHMGTGQGMAARRGFR